MHNHYIEKAVLGLVVILLILSITSKNLVYAQESLIPNFRLSGYGTLAFTVDDREDMASLRDFSQKPDDAFNDDWTWKLDSRIGLQADYRASDNITFVLQGVLRDQVELTPRSSIESAYVNVKPSPWIDLRLGRLGYDAFLMSDTRNVGYAYIWVRPPTEFYGWIPVFSVDGIDSAFTINKWDAQWRIKAQLGQSRDVAFPMGDETYDFKTKYTYSFTLSRESGPFRIKAGYSQFIAKNEASPFAPLHAGLDAIAEETATFFPQISAEASDLRKNMSFKDIMVGYTTIGAAYDDGSWIAQAEFGHSSSTADALPLGDMAYLGVGHRFFDWTPYLLFSIVIPNNDKRMPVNDWSAIGQEDFYSQVLHFVNSTRLEQQTFSLGVRWDFHNKAALKIQWDTTRVEPWGYGLWWRDSEILTRSSRINVGTIGVEFIF
ncbi:conserved hypothetical protein [Desulfamplus magnetovallimortis]|uniref:Porin domain-containing protein n=1 Tax=Desulfamplus magnetovallimortis TaxID=1246637 RepID=A0A1W1H8K2_9BACT|nr:hypothetical protein [Desulfamplus magnetovallimortis]SLM28820.1 conserved hypothetical protein [Desulfamplus magnetovallimortis]